MRLRVRLARLQRMQKKKKVNRSLPEEKGGRNDKAATIFPIAAAFPYNDSAEYKLKGCGKFRNLFV